MSAEASPVCAPSALRAGAASARCSKARARSAAASAEKCVRVLLGVVLRAQRVGAPAVQPAALRRRPGALLLGPLTRRHPGAP
jgi:hypothetical protein